MGKRPRNAAAVAGQREAAPSRPPPGTTWPSTPSTRADGRSRPGARDDIEMAAPPQDAAVRHRLAIPRPGACGARRTASGRSPSRPAGSPPWTRTTSPAPSSGSFARTATTTCWGTTPRTSAADGAFRRIEVRVSRPGVTVVARKGYVRPGARRASGERGRRRAAAPGDVARAARAARQPLAAARAPLGVTAAVFRASGRDADRGRDHRAAGPGTALPARGRSGRQRRSRCRCSRSTQTGRVQARRPVARPAAAERARRSSACRARACASCGGWSCPPGRYQLRVAAREAEQGRRGSVFYDLQVPDFGAQALAMSGVLLTSREAALGRSRRRRTRSLKALLETPPTVSRAFARERRAHAPTPRCTTRWSRPTTWPSPRGSRARRPRGLPGPPAPPLAELQAAGGGSRHTRWRSRSRAWPRAPTGSRSRPRRRSARTRRRASCRSRSSRPAGPASAEGIARRRPRRRGDRWRSPAPRRGSTGSKPGSARWSGTCRERPTSRPSWSGPGRPRTLLELATDVAMVVSADRRSRATSCCGSSIPSAPAGRSARPTASTTSDASARCRASAIAARDPGARCGCAPERPGCANRLLKRGAMLHTDAAIHLGDAAAGRGCDGDPRPDRWSIRFSDGQPARPRRQRPGTGSWRGRCSTTSRRTRRGTRPCASGTSRPPPTRSPTSGTPAMEDRAAQLFPEDAEVLFLAGSLHETFASPRIQSLVRSIRLPVGRRARGRSEIVRASRGREALPARPRARAGVHGGTHPAGPRPAPARPARAGGARAAAGGRRAVVGRPMAAADDGLLPTTRRCSSARRAKSLGRHEAARVSYARAAALYPGAPSPLLALSRLALSRQRPCRRPRSGATRRCGRRGGRRIATTPCGGTTSSRAAAPTPGSTSSTGRSRSSREARRGRPSWPSSRVARRRRAAQTPPTFSDRRRSDPRGRPGHRRRSPRAGPGVLPTSRSATTASCRTWRSSPPRSCRSTSSWRSTRARASRASRSATCAAPAAACSSAWSPRIGRRWSRSATRSPSRQALTRDVARVGRALGQVEPRGETAVIDASYAAVMLGEADVGRDLLIVFSDGVDTASWLHGERVLEAARRVGRGRLRRGGARARTGRTSCAS